MERSDLLKKIYQMYPKYFGSEEHFNTWADNYKLILPEKYDYTELYRKMVLSFTDMHKPPSPAELNKIRLELATETKTYTPFSDGVPPPPKWYEARKHIEKLAESKKF